MVRKRWTVRMLSFKSVYVAVETNCTEQAHVSRAWIREVAEPYRTGQGWRARLGHFAVQAGTCTQNPDVGEDIELFRQHVFMKWTPYRPGGPDGDAPGEGHEERDRLDQVREDERVDVRNDGVVGGDHLQGVQPLRVGPGPDDAGVEDAGAGRPAGDPAEDPTVEAPIEEARFDFIAASARAVEERAIWQAIETQDRQGA